MYNWISNPSHKALLFHQQKWNSDFVTICMGLSYKDFTILITVLRRSVDRWLSHTVQAVKCRAPSWLSPPLTHSVWGESWGKLWQTFISLACVGVGKRKLILVWSLLGESKSHYNYRLFYSNKFYHMNCSVSIFGRISQTPPIPEKITQRSQHIGHCLDTNLFWIKACS